MLRVESAKCRSKLQVECGSVKVRSGRLAASLVSCLLVCPLLGHGPASREHPRTHSFTLPAEADLNHPHLMLTVLDDESGEPTAARFTLQVDGSDFVPDQIGPAGIRLVSIHTRKRHYFPITYTRGTVWIYSVTTLPVIGPRWIPLVVCPVAKTTPSFPGTGPIMGLRSGLRGR